MTRTTKKFADYAMEQITDDVIALSKHIGGGAYIAIGFGKTVREIIDNILGPDMDADVENGKYNWAVIFPDGAERTYCHIEFSDEN